MIKVLNVNNNFIQISNIKKLATNNTIIIVSNLNQKYQILKMNLIPDQKFDNAIKIEQEISQFSDIIALYKEISFKNIVNILNNKLLKTELKIDNLNDSVFSFDKYPAIQNAIEESKQVDNFIDFISIWLDNYQEPLLIIDFLEQIIENKSLFLENLYSGIFNENIYICLPNEIPNKKFSQAIILDSNLEYYNRVMPYLCEQNIDILPSEDSKINEYFLIASVILQSKNVVLINNLQNKNISYLLLYYNKNIENIETCKNNIIIEKNNLYSGILSCSLTPKSIEKLLTNPFYFYLEYILNLKESKQIRENIFNYDTEIAVNNILQNIKLDYYESLSILDKYKITKNKNKIFRTLKCYNNFNDKSVENMTEKNNFQVKNIEISINPAFKLSDNLYFYSKSSQTKITNGQDIQSLIIGNFIKNSIFLNYKDQTIATTNADQNQSINNLINYYTSQDCIYKNTNIIEGFNKNYQHLSRNLLLG